MPVRIADLFTPQSLGITEQEAQYVFDVWISLDGFLNVPCRVPVSFLRLSSPAASFSNPDRAKENAWTDELEAMDGFLLSGSAFRKLPQERIGHFFSKECYLYLVTQWRPIVRAVSGTSLCG
jgi:hypothetical protein